MAPINMTSDWINNVTTFVFLIEFLLKIISWGFIAHKGAYLRDPWNILDFIIVLTG